MRFYPPHIRVWDQAFAHPNVGIFPNANEDQHIKDGYDPDMCRQGLDMSTACIPRDLNFDRWEGLDPGETICLGTHPGSRNDEGSKIQRKGLLHTKCFSPHEPVRGRAG